MTAEPMSSKRPVLGITLDLFFCLNHYQFVNFADSEKSINLKLKNNLVFSSIQVSF